MQTILDNRLMRAADAVIRQGEFVKCELLRNGERTECQLIGRMEGGARLQRWFDGKMGQSPVPFSAVLLDEATAARLEAVAVAQEAPRREVETFLRGHGGIPIRGTWRRAGKVARRSAAA